MRPMKALVSDKLPNAALRVSGWLPLLGLAVAISAVPVAAQEQPLPEGVTPELIADGKAIFLGAGMCFICHGMEATGGIGANLTDDDWWHSDGSYDGIVNQILTGVPAEKVRNEMGAAMPPKGGSSIDDAQVKAVAAYVWSLRLGDEPEGAHFGG